MSNLLTKKNLLYFAILVLCLINYIMVVILPHETFLELVEEDGFFENIGAICFLVTAILLFTLFFKKESIQSPEDRMYFNTLQKRTWFFLLGLLFIVLLGEEISWGQRIFGFATPERWAKDNMQEETTLHNHKWFHPSTTRAGAEKHELKTGIAALLTAKKIFVYIFVAYLFLLPLGVKFFAFIKNLARRFYLPVPDIQLGMLFIINVLLFKAFKPFAMGLENAPVGMGRGLGELEECNFAIILLFIPLIWFNFSNKKSTERNTLNPVPKRVKS